MSNRPVIVKSQGSPPFTYVPPSPHMVHNYDTMKWKSDDGDIQVTFPHGDPTGGAYPNGVSAPIHQFTTSVPLVGASGSQVKYDVTVNGVLDDPMIIFGDRDADVVADLGEVARQAQETLDHTVRAILPSSMPAEQSDKLFPNGITNISVSVSVASVTVAVTISGPNNRS